MSNPKLVTKTFTLYEETAQGIETFAEYMGVEEGHAVDLMFTKFCPRDAEYAKILLTEYLLMVTSELAGEDMAAVFLQQINTSAYLLGQMGYPPRKLGGYIQDRLEALAREGVSFDVAEKELYRKFVEYLRFAQ